MNRIERLLYGYIKGKTKRNWLSKEIICTPTLKGGLGFFNIKEFYFAQKLTLLRRYAKDQTDDIWCDHLDSLLGVTPMSGRLEGIGIKFYPMDILDYPLKWM